MHIYLDNYVRWRVILTKEVITFEAKIEQTDSQRISAHDVGQAHNQLTREREGSLNLLGISYADQ